MNTENSTITPFLFGENLVRTEIRDSGPVFVIADLCKILEHSNPTMMTERLHPDDLSTAEVIDSLGRTQTVNVCNESGLYSLVFQSRKPIAREFTRWVTSEVLPQIRRTGSYNPQHQAYLNLIQDQIRMGVSPDLAAKGAIRLSPFQPTAHTIARRFAQSIQDEELQQLLDLMEPDVRYTSEQLAAALPVKHRVHGSTKKYIHSTIGLILKPGVLCGRVIRHKQKPPHRIVTYSLPAIARFAAAES